ncbi:MAG: NADH-quinone oxidoreductase subunit L [Dehalococcoidia bacterium]
MFSEAAAWLILALPLASFLLVSLFIRPFLGAANRVAGWVTILAIGGSFILSLAALSSVVSNGAIEYPVREWISVLGFEITFGFLLDPLTAIMLVVVSGVSLLVQIYSQAYMHGDRSYARYYAYMSLFTASMLGLVTGRNVVQVFVFWELVGVSSYLLIGFWMERPTAAAAAKKAFLITRFGDFGFLLGILYLYSIDPAYLDIPALYQAAGAGLIAASAATWVALGFFMGAVGKSAQFPLHNWLPDAMEGPTPVSALIHSATMVTAGVFLIARFFPLFEASDAMLLVALIGGFTAVFAASMGLVANDIKRVLAYSTISQLGYMVFALGIGAYAPAIFHLFTHAFFKAALFLGSGSVHHASGTFNMRYMGGLRKVMPYTYAGMVIASLSLAGVFPLSGFWSKDEILATAFERGSGIGYLVLALGLTAAIMTAFYMFRAIFMTFHGEYRGGAEAEMEDLKNTRQEAPAVLGHTHLAESPWMMVGPIAVLAVLAIGIGFLVNPTVALPGVDQHAFSHFITDNTAVFPTHDDAVHAGAAPEFNWLIAGVSTALALGGIAIAYMMYISGAISPARLGAQFPTVYRLLIGKYYIDELYEDQIVRKGFYGTAARAVNWADGAWLDNVNVQVSAWTSRLGRGLAQIQNGQTQAYALVMAAGLIVVIAAFVAWGI